LQLDTDDGIVVVDEEPMHARSASAALTPMNERDEYILQTATDRFERRLAEENGKLRVELSNGFGRLATEMAGLRGDLRAEMVERNHELLKWGLVFWVTLIATIAGLLALFV
jgi:hypothetical protein